MHDTLNRLALGAILLLAAMVPAAAAADSRAAELLAKADEVRNPPGSFSIDLTLLEYKAGALTGKSALTVYSKPTADGAQYNNLVRYQTPSRDTGKLLLRNGLDVWFYDPGSQASVRISPQARLMGQASNGDVMTTRLDKDYVPTVAGRDKLEAAVGGVEAVRLHLVAARPDVTYSSVDYWIDEGSGRPLKAQYYTAEGRLLKTAYFRRYQSELGRERPTETVIVDGIDKTWITVMRSSDYTQRDIPQSWLQRDFLSRFDPDHG